jgi:hypothetical protein
VDASVCAGCTYLYGVNARTAPGESAGTLQIGIQVLDTQASGGKCVRCLCSVVGTARSHFIPAAGLHLVSHFC